MKKKEWVAQLEFLAKTSKELSLDLLQALGEFYTQMDFAYRHPSFMGNPFGPEILAEIREAQLRREIRKQIYELRRKNLVRVRKEGERMMCKMTKKGVIQSLSRTICQQEQLLPKRRYTIVVFDIPEGTRVTRWWLRQRLKEFGFTIHQRSVWVSQKDVAREMKKYVQLIGAQKRVSVFQGELL